MSINTNNLISGGGVVPARIHTEEKSTICIGCTKGKVCKYTEEIKKLELELLEKIDMLGPDLKFLFDVKFSCRENCGQVSYRNAK